MDERSLPLSTCVVNLHDGTITGHDGSFLSRLAPGVLKLLCYLEHRVGESVSKEQLIAEVWGGSVKEGAVGVAIGRLRSALQDTEKVIVETVETMMGSSYRLNLGRAAARPPISSNLDRYAGAFEGGGRGRPGWSQRLLRARRIALRGPSGVGKTHLALGIARALRAPGYGLTGGIWFIDLGYAVEGREITAALRRTLGPHRHSPSSGPSPRLLVFDNCGACGPALAAVLHGLNRERDGLHWLVLSRHPLKLPACEIIDLKWLDREAEMALFLSRPWRVEHPVPGGREQQEVRALVRRLGGQPLWIRLFGLLSDTMPVAALNRCLDEMGVRAPLRRGDPRSTSTARLLDWLWSQLSELERRVLARILLAREGGTLDELGAPSENWRLAGAVRQLQSYGVVWCLRQEDQRPCVRVLPVAWDHLRRHPETAEHRKQEIVVLLQRLEERDRRPSDREIAALVAVVRAPASWGLDWDTRAHAAMLSIPITSAQGKGVLSCEDLEALRDAHTGVPTARLAAIERALSEAYFRAVRLTEAREVLESALEAAKRAGALECQGRILINLAALARRFGDMGGARSWLQDARLLAEQCGGERLGGWVLRGRANLARHEGNLDEAIELHRAALSTYERLGPREMRVVTFHDMGLCLLEQGRLEEARTAARRAKALLSASPDIGLLGICHNLAGRIDLERCEYISARDHFREAHAIFIRGDNQRQGAVAELNRGMAELQLDNCAAARACMERALLSLEEEGEEAPPPAAAFTVLKAQCMSMFGLVLHLDEEFAKATDCYEKAAELARSLNNPLGIALAVGNQALVDLELGELLSAARHLEEADAEWTRLGCGKKQSLRELGQCRAWQGVLHAMSSAPEKAEAYFDSAEVILLAVGDEDTLSFRVQRAHLIEPDMDLDVDPNEDRRPLEVRIGMRILRASQERRREETGQDEPLRSPSSG